MLVSLNTVLIVEENRAFLQTLRRAATQRGLSVYESRDIDGAHAIVDEIAPDYAVIEATRGQADISDFILHLLQVNRNCRFIVTSAHASIASAVAVIKAGATDYIPKPTTAERVFQSFSNESISSVMELRPMNPERLYWEYINQVLRANDHNVSVTARKLKMHRRSLQRILNKTAPPEYPTAHHKQL